MKKIIYPVVAIVLVIAVVYWRFGSFFNAESDKKQGEETKETVGQKPDQPQDKTSEVPAKRPILKQTQKPGSLLTPEQNSLNALQYAQQLLAADENEQAVAALKAALELDPENLELLAKLGNIYLEVYKQSKEARSYFERAMAKNPDDGELLSKLVGIYQETGDLQGGLAFLNKLTSTHSENSNPFTAAADLLIASNRLPEAASMLERAVKMKNATDGTQYLYADTLTRLGTPDAFRRADEVYQTILASREKILQERIAKGQPSEVAQTNRDLTLMDLVRFRIKEGKQAEAEKMIQDLRERRPNDERLTQLTHELNGQPPARLSE